MDVEANHQPKQERSRKRWTPFLDKVLADLVVKQIQARDGQNNVFDRKTWNNIRVEFNEQTELNFNNNQLRKHLDVLRQRYNTLKSSHDHNEFVIEDTGCIMGFDLWEDCGVEARSEPVKVKDCPIYEQLCTIFADDSVDGRYAQSSHFEGLEESIAAENISTSNTTQAKTNLVDRKRKREPDSKSSLNPSQIYPEALETMAGTLLNMVTALKSRMEDSKTQEDRFSITNCIKVLDEIENMDEGVYFAALDLFENPGLREIFLSLNTNKLRLTWLQGVRSRIFTMENKCEYTVWPGLLSNAGIPPLPTTGFILQKGEARTIQAPASWGGRFWGRTQCSTSTDGIFTCLTGDCGSGKIECSGSGAIPPATLAEFTLDGYAGLDFYDVSLVDGYNVPMLVVPQGGSGLNCNSTGCVADLNDSCPSELKVTTTSGGGSNQTIACKSACEAFRTPEYCCSGSHGTPDTCKPSSYSLIFKTACPRAYSYAYDDQSSTFTCAQSPNYLITFCPSPYTRLQL